MIRAMLAPLVLAMVLGSASVSSATLYEVTFTDLRWEPNYDRWELVFPGFPRPTEPPPPRSFSGSFTWDSDQLRVTDAVWSLGGVWDEPIIYWEHAALTANAFIIQFEGNPNIPGFIGSGLFQFIVLTAPGTFPNLDVGPVPVNLNRMLISETLWSGQAISGSESVGVIAVPESPTWLLMVAGVAALIASARRGRG